MLHPREVEFLGQVAKRFGITETEFSYIKVRHEIVTKRNPEIRPRTALLPTNAPFFRASDVVLNGSDQLTIVFLDRSQLKVPKGPSSPPDVRPRTSPHRAFGLGLRQYPRFH